MQIKVAEWLMLLLLLLSWRHLCLSDKPVEEGGVWEETILILRVGKLVQDLLGVLLGDGVSCRCQTNDLILGTLKPMAKTRGVMVDNEAIEHFWGQSPLS